MTDKIFKYSGWLFIIVIIASATYMGWVIHPQAEDINSYANNPELLSRLDIQPPSLSTLAESSIDGYCHDSGRFVFISNVFLMSLCPRWAWSVLNALFLTGFFLFVFKCLKFSNIQVKESANIILLTGVLVLLFLPWHDMLFIECYMTPYVWGSTLMLATAYGCLLVANGIAISTVGYVSLCLCAFFTGGWHEGFSISLTGGLVMLWIVTTRKFRRRLIWPLIFLMSGTVANVFAPGQFERIGEVGMALNIVNWFQPYTLTKGVWLWPHIVPMLLYIFLVVIALCANYGNVVGEIKKSWSQIITFQGCGLSWSIQIQLICMTIVGVTLLTCLYFASARVAMPGAVMSVVGIVSLVSGYFISNDSAIRRLLLSFVLSLSAIAFSVSIILNISMQRRLSGDHGRIEGLLAESEDGQVFYDPMEWPHVSHYPWQWTINHYYVDGVPLHFILAHPSNTRHLPLRLVPTSLAKIPASVRIDGITLLGKDIVSDREPEYTSGTESVRTEIFHGEYPFMKINAHVKTASGRDEIRFFEVIPFITSQGTADERTLYYFRPVWRSWEDISDPAVEILSVCPAKYW